MKVAAYQAPLLSAGSMEAIGLIRTRVEWCEAEGVSILCCPEAVLGGLADYSAHPARFMIAADDGQLDSALAPLANDTVTTIVGFTELADGDRLYNSAAVFQRGSVVGLYRKLHPAINRSVYEAGCKVPVFQVGGLTFGILICNDSNYCELARLMAAHGATALFVPTNNGLPPARAYRSLSLRRETLTSLWRSRTAFGSSAPTSLVAPSNWCLTGHPGSLIQKVWWCSRPDR